MLTALLMQKQLITVRFDDASHTGGGYVHQAAAVRPEPFSYRPSYRVNIPKLHVRS